MREVTFVDIVGRMWLVSLPDDAPDSAASTGIPIGPPSIEGLGLPLETEIALHNQLFGRKIFTSKIAKARRADLISAIQGALKLDGQKIIDLYLELESGNGENRLV